MSRFCEPDVFSLSGVRSEKGCIDRPVSATNLVVPSKVEVEGGQLIWTHHLDPWCDESPPAQLVAPHPKLLEQFICLSNGKSNDIAAFASKWGVLGICKHGLPRTHIRKMDEITDAELYCSPVVFESPDALVRRGYEPLDSWRHYACRAQMMLSAAGWLYQNDIVKDERVAKELCLPVGYGMKADQIVKLQTQCLKSEVNRWLLLGAVRPIFYWPYQDTGLIQLGATSNSWSDRDSKLLLRFSGDWQGTTLFGALAVQLMMAISRTEGLLFCSGCKQPYVPSRRMDTNRKHFCPSCRREGVPLRLNSQRYRQTAKYAEAAEKRKKLRSGDARK